MADEIKHLHDDAAETLYAIVRHPTNGQFYAGTSPENFLVANWATYDIALAEENAAATGNGMYEGDMPAIAAGWYWVDIYVQAAGAPAQTDVLIDSTYYYWDGTTLYKDGLQYISESLAAAADSLYNPDASSTITTGNQDAGTWASTETDNATYWDIGDTGTGIEVVCECNLGTNRHATSVAINGYFDSGASRVVEIYYWNYTSGAYVKLSAGTALTEMRNSASDNDYVFSLPAAATNPAAVVGEVKIRFLSAQSNNGDTLKLDYVAVTGASTGGATPTAIADAVWHNETGEQMLHIPKYTAHIWYVDGTNGDDANAGTGPHEAYATIGAAIAGASAGDRIVVQAGSYTEAGIDMNLAGLELWAEHGTIMTGGGSGTVLVVSGSNCLVKGVWVTPGAGQIGIDIAAATHRVVLECCISYSSGATGFRTATDAGRATFRDCEARGYSATGFELQGPAPALHNCHAIAAHGSSTRGFYLSNAACDRGEFFRCGSINNGTASFAVVAGADENVFVQGSTSDGCGAIADAGTDNAWRCMCTADVQAVNTTQWLGTACATPTTAGVPEVDVTYLGGSAVQQSSGYIKVSDGTGTGQIALASGKVDVSHLAGSAIQQASGYVKLSVGTGTGQVQLASGLIRAVDSNGSQLANHAEAAAILVDTNELQTDWMNGGRLDTIIDAILADTGTDGVLVAPTGLDKITATAPSGVATTYPEMVVQLWRRFFKKATKTNTELITYADNGSDVLTTQVLSDDSTTETQGAAS